MFPVGRVKARFWQGFFMTQGCLMMSEATKAQRLQEELTRAVGQRDLYVKELYKTTQRFEEKVRELSVVRRIGESLKYTRDIRMVFQVLIDTIIDETNAENCSLMLLNRDTNELAVRAARGQQGYGNQFLSHQWWIDAHLQA